MKVFSLLVYSCVTINAPIGGDLGVLRASLLQNSGAYSSASPSTTAPIAKLSAMFMVERDDSKASVSNLTAALAAYRKKEQWLFICLAAALVGVALTKLFRS